MNQTTKLGNRGRRTPRFLVLLFDESCPLCRTLRTLLSTRRPIVAIHLVGVGSPLAAKLFPDLDLAAARETLTVVDDVGTLYQGDAAWIVCAWALPGLRGAADHFATGWRRNVVRAGANTLNKVRQFGRATYPEPDAESDERACADSCPSGLPSWLGADAHRERGIGSGH